MASEDAQKLADFVIFSQRSCMLRLSPKLSEGRLSYPQFFLLAYLAEEEGLSMSNIAKMMGHSTAAATGMVDKLQELNYITRSTAAADRRKILVRITSKGRQVVEQMRSNIAQDFADMMQTSNSSSIKQASKVIAKHKKIVK